MEDFHERWLRMLEYREEVLDNLHFEAIDWQESGGMPVDYDVFYHYLLPEGEYLMNEPSGDCYIHRVRTFRGSWFKTITKVPINLFGV